MRNVTQIIDKIRYTVRYKLLVLVLFPILLVMPIALMLAIYWGANFSYDQLYIKVNTDLSVSHDIFERIKRDYLNTLALTAESYAFRTALTGNQQSSIARHLDALKASEKLSYIKLLNATGTEVIHSSQWPAKSSIKQSSALRSAILGKASSAVDIFTEEDLLAENLAEQVRLPIIDTPRARPSDKKSEQRGMMIRAVYPVLQNNQVIAILDAGVLLNKNFTFVDVIRDLVYGPGSLVSGSIGTVTVFLEDVRISTNVPTGNSGERALGTRVSNEVRTRVLDQGETWIDRAFVVNDWYISSYEPILDIDNKRVGMLYAGFLEAPFLNSLLQALMVLVLLFFVLMGLTALVAVFGAKSIFKPIELMSQVISATRKGEEKRIGKIKSQDELGTLAHEFDAMLDLLKDRNLLIQNWANELEEKVDERTSELKVKNRELTETIKVLRKTRQQLVIAEKLAALGELTAGVAHEINNPTAVMLGNLDVIIGELGPQLEPVQDEIDLIVKQIYRIKDITSNLLQYAKPDAYAGYMTEVDVNELIHETLKLVQHLRTQQDYDIELELSATHLICINQQELQQILVNLVVNAIQALPEDNAQLYIQTQDISNPQGVEIVIRDNGHGIDDEQLSKIFNPFYSNKSQGEGTGLGLSICYTLVRRYGGNIDVISRPDAGTEFKVNLQCEPELMEDEKMIKEQLDEIELSATN